MSLEQSLALCRETLLHTGETITSANLLRLFGKRWGSWSPASLKSPRMSPSQFSESPLFLVNVLTLL